MLTKQFHFFCVAKNIKSPCYMEQGLLDQLKMNMQFIIIYFKTSFPTLMDDDTLK